MRYFLSIFLPLSLILASCEKPVEGCTDPLSLNHDPLATDDNGSCTYLSDLYTGTYLVSDSFQFKPVQIAPDDTTVNQYTMTIEKTDHNHVVVSKVADCTSVTAVASNTLLDIQGCAMTNATFTRNGTEIRYKYNYGVYYIVWGTARKQ
jgi:hypothetical protein